MEGVSLRASAPSVFKVECAREELFIRRRAVFTVNLRGTMATELISKLLNSFQELERCISVTRDVLHEREDVPADVLDRVNQYSDMVAKQRSLALELEELIATQRWEEVSRNVKLINAYSSMIREDAQEILTAASTGAQIVLRNERYLA